MKLPSAKVRKSRNGSPLIWPPMTNEGLKVKALFSRCFPWRSSTSRIASETTTAISNIVRTLQMFGTPSCASPLCFRTLTTACVPARLPELNSTITRSPMRSKTVILQNCAKLSTPAWVRESDARTIPSLSRIPTQYVMRGPYHRLAARPPLDAQLPSEGLGVTKEPAVRAASVERRCPHDAAHALLEATRRAAAAHARLH